MVATQKAESLATLAEGEVNEKEGEQVGLSEAEKREIAAYLDSRMNLIAGLAILLGISVVTNLLLIIRW